jgi:UDP-glucose 4-epimerase
MAALADVVPSIEAPRDYYEVNVSGTFNVLECSKEAGVKRFLYTASSSCYGIPENYPTSEDAPIQPQYPYALTKLLGEELVMHWEQVYKIPCLSLRLFNVYGPRARTTGTYGAVFGVFLTQKLNNKPMTVVGNGSQTRDFTFVKDVARAFLAGAESSVSGEIFNVGSGNHYSVNRIVELLSGDSVNIPKRPGEPDCTFADTTKIEKMLRFKAETPFEEGVKQLLENIDDFREAPLWDPSSIEDATKTWFQYLS